MDTVLLLLIVVNLLLSIGLLLLVLSRGRGEAVSPELRQELHSQRAELVQTVSGGQQQTDARLGDLRTTLEQRFDVLRDENERKLEQMRITVDEKLHTTLKSSLEENARRIQELTDRNTEKQAELRKTLSEELEKLRVGNEQKLEKMRETVDEKLQGTLEKRLGESFSLVSERLEQVQKGLGEMQTLASDVGGLKRVLTNVKSRGGWGEVQLARQLEDVLTPEQYAENVAVRPDSNDRVEFAVKLPGTGDGETPVWLPIDSKFPQEDYERLLVAQESGDIAAIEMAGKEIEKAILTQAKLISSKYVEPPHTTDFAIMYLPTEGLFAEVMRRPGFVSRLHNEHRVAVSGPTTLMSLLNSLQMGFRTLAIEKRSSEVWKVLSAAKAEFQKYGQVWEKLGKQLQTAQNTVSEAGRRTRAVERKLRGVESLELGETTREMLGERLAELELSPSDDAVGADGLETLGFDEDEEASVSG
ncbi:DNA recombination protein RmuC [Microbacterium sp. NIBRBAC000506063]|uniref:DNA recombination protein RmuC n=1 Tax=Microbacterium sp. NIBRBAC000506063 TaxID=2734618 RepID=UPI001BB692E8|nr:DNA recombination protein RmuC [Microbacterium sp. NIBRBAC000506063]QTV80119.1 DNA recombination protein RmuC [Microbacterium sp. NIBRBAC000506063]